MRGARGRDAPPLAIGTVGDGSNASHPDSRAWIDFVDGLGPFNPPPEAPRGTLVTATLHRQQNTFAGSAATVSWQLSTERQFWSTAEVKFRYLDSELLVTDEPLLQLYHSSDGNEPFTPLTSVVNALDNTVTANVDELGFFFLGIDDVVFTDGFE